MRPGLSRRSTRRWPECLRHRTCRPTFANSCAPRSLAIPPGIARSRAGSCRRTLGSLIGSGFAAGLLVTLALPWIKAHFGDNGVFALPAIGAAIGLALSLNAWWQGSSLARSLS
jgi:hypothetical protein